LCTDIFRESFIAPLDAWCRSHGKRFAAHVKGEEHPLFQVPMVGSLHRVFRGLGLPGIDALERFPSGEFFPRQIASIAQQFGDGRCMVECFGGAGWGAKPEDLERFLLWLGRHGLTDFVFHLWQYKLTSHAIRDWPASIPVHVNWRDAFPDVLRRVRARLASEPVTAIDTLVVSPHRGIMQTFEPRELRAMNIHNAATYADSPAGRINTAFLEVVAALQAAGAAYHVADELTFEEGAVDADGGVRIGSCRYARLVVAEDCAFTPRGEQMVRAAREAGGRDFPPQIRTPAHSGSTSAVTPTWSAVGGAGNEYVLEPQRDGDGVWIATFDSEDAFDIELCFADPVTEVEFQAVRPGRNTVRFRMAPDVSMPFVWLRGTFEVHSKTPFTPGPNGTVRTDGPFVLRRGSGATSGTIAFVETGSPFARTLPRLEARIALSGGTRTLELDRIEADAARVRIDDRDCGLTYGPAWRVDLPPDVAAAPGEHVLALELIPSTYNFFGPHHHVDGDCHIVSPGQYAGRKNFADRADAPQVTRVAAWHFKPVRPPALIRFLAQP
jgi:hypothetical protein